MGFDEGVLIRSSMPWLLPFTRFQLIRLMHSERDVLGMGACLAWEWSPLWPMAA